LELRLEEERLSRELLEDLRDIVFRYPWECKLFFKVDMEKGDAVTISAHDRFNVHPCHELIDQLEARIGTKVQELVSTPLA
jgi:DNA polymerase-3 subunit alpha